MEASGTIVVLVKGIAVMAAYVGFLGLQDLFSTRNLLVQLQTGTDVKPQAAGLGPTAANGVGAQGLL